MPIRFRCRYCSQLMGISRMQAGKVVDCPSCGRQLRVPVADGRGQAVPAPKLDLADNRLADALNELARIATPEAGGSATASDDGDLEFADASAMVEEEATIGDGQPAPEAEVVTLDPLPVPEPVELEPLAPRPLPEPPAGSGTAGVAAAEVTSWPVELFPAESGEVAERGPAGESFWNRRRLTAAVSTLLVVFLGGLASGWWLGTGDDSAGRTPRNVATHNSDDGAAATDRAGDGIAGGTGDGTTGTGPASAVPPGQPALAGRVTSKTVEGDSRPDAGARVILLPLEYEGEERVPARGLRNGDSPDDLQAARAALRQLGGDVALADARGEFRLELPRAGSWRLLVISRSQSRPGGDEPRTGLLEQYFTDPRQLLGRLAWQLGRVRSNGRDAVVWDHSFEPPE